MKISDFEKGQTAYILNGGYYRKGEIMKCKVVTVGRKYVTVSSLGNFSNTKKFAENEVYDNALSEATDFGNEDLLFKTVEDIEKHNELKELRRWFSAEASSFKKCNSYSIEQLRKVKEILEERGQVTQALKGGNEK